MKLIIGLGNIGKNYENTYHNCGFLVVDKLLDEFGVHGGKKQCDAEIFECNIGGEKVIFAKPQTYMNASGKSFAALQKKYKLNAADIAVVYDDMDIEPGNVRIRNNGSAGTHNGMKSVLALCDGTDFLRFRVGTGRPQNEQLIVDYVLSPIPKKSQVFDGIEKCVQAIKELLMGETFEIVRTKYSK